jgi:hypothetical protein
MTVTSNPLGTLFGNSRVTLSNLVGTSSPQLSVISVINRVVLFALMPFAFALMLFAFMLR